ncbi:MAG: DUF420 domain-containing protein [Isosphaeraceae bacterium]|nr:DUF420 domain-containing protein [Isosphaeraceae bacterium]
MDASYRLGLTIVVAAVILAAGLAPIVPGPPERPAGEDLERAPVYLGAFQLTERSGRTVTEADLADRIWIAAFIFSRCPSSCPRISAVMKGLQDRLETSGIRLVSISVDPDYDSPEVLRGYARRFGADPERWWFLTGPKEDVYRLILDRFQVEASPTSAEDRKQGAEAVSHSGRLALVDRGNKVVGYYDSTDPEAITRLWRKARLLDRAWVRRLPAVNAMLNGTCALLLLTGWTLIRAGRVRGHIACMVMGLIVSAAFLTCYLLYHSFAGSVPFRGVGPIRLAYFTVLLSHTALAAGMVPFVVLTIVRALRRRWTEHARIARLTLPLWLYVSITGVLVYLMLYQMPIRPGLSP